MKGSRSTAFAIAVAAFVLFNVSDGAITCDSTAFCKEAIRPGSICLDETSTCSNPYQRGCLATLLPEEEGDRFTIRVCNSDDVLPDAIEQGLCYRPDFDYEEIRIHNGNWESSIFLSWIMQILLMEVVQVPATVGLGPDTREGSFYNVESNLAYSSAAYPFSSLEEANKVGDCRLTTNECSHVMPEVWNGQQHEYTRALDEGFIDPLEGNGQVGKGSWYLPKFAANRDDTLVSVFGLSGERNRRKLADAFRRPTTWVEYCEQVSTTNCTEPDDTASRYPATPDEQSLYFAGPASFVGYFRLTDQNNCTINPTTCAGHIVGPPCTWSTNVDSQLYWNDIKLVPDGPIKPNGGYNYGSMVQIWRAANWTKSNVVFWWWRPDALVEEYHGTDSQFQQILLPEATDTCQRARVDTEARCSEDILDRRGNPDGACDQEAHALQKVFAKTLRDRVYNAPRASRSPGYDLLQNLKINDLEINNMIRRWLQKGVDKHGNDARDAVCSWVVDNLDTLLDNVPEGYPRILSNQSSYDAGFLRFAQAMAAVTACIVLVVTALTVKYRKTKVFVVAQAYLCWLILVGFFLVSMGSVVTSLEPSNFSCTLRVWLVMLGYTVELVPLLVKIAAINTILQSAKKLKRVKISPSKMMTRVGLVVAGVSVYVSLWTSLDAPVETEFLALESERSQLVFRSLLCSSQKHQFWYLLGLGWQILLLIVASVLAFQSRKVVQEFNESKSLGTMVYSHFLFVVCRAVLFFVGRQSDSGWESSAYSAALKPNVVATLESLLLSWDTIVALGIYILPKLLEAKVAPDDYDPKKHGSLVRPGLPSVAMSNISLIESRAAEAHKSYVSSRSVTTESTTIAGTEGSSLRGWPSLRRKASTGQRSTSFRSSQGSFDGSRRASSGMFTRGSSSTEFRNPSGRNLFTAGLVPVSNQRATAQRVSMVQEASCEISRDSGLASSGLDNHSSRRLSQGSSALQLSSPNNSSRQLKTEGASQRALEGADSMHRTTQEEPTETYVGEESDFNDEDDPMMSPDDLHGEPGSRHSNACRIDATGNIGLSSLHSATSLQMSSVEFGGDDDGSLSDSSDEHDTGGPRWSKPELNEVLNISVRSIDDHDTNPSGRRRSSSSSFSRPRLARARDFKPMPVIRSTSIDAPSFPPERQKSSLGGSQDMPKVVIEDPAEELQPGDLDDQ